jgi:CHAT domain-containing protein
MCTVERIRRAQYPFDITFSQLRRGPAPPAPRDGAGARSVVATQWTVSDEASELLARRFYERLNAGDPTDEALRRAKLASMVGERVATLPVRGSAAFRPERDPAGAPAHPAFWAPFVLWGGS